MSGGLTLVPGGSGKPLSPEMALAAKIHERTQIEGARVELTMLRRGLDARIKQLTDHSAQLNQECDQMADALNKSRSKKIVVTNQMPPPPEMK